MKLIHYRVDVETGLKMDAFDLSHSEISRRTARRVEGGKYYPDKFQKGTLTRVITAELSDNLSNVSTDQIRNGVIEYFSENNPRKPCPDIESELKYLEKLSNYNNVVI